MECLLKRPRLENDAYACLSYRKAADEVVAGTQVKMIAVQGNLFRGIV